MLKISEHFEYYYNNHIDTLRLVANWKNFFNEENSMDTIFFDADHKDACVSLVLSKDDEQQEVCSITSSYYIGLDKFSKLGLPVYIQPKINNEHHQLNYIKMLFEALKEPENFEHLGGLVQVKFDNEWIEIENELQPILTPFLIAQFLSVVKLIVKKGLKKSYYSKTDNLSGRVKGKVVIGRQVKENILKNKLTHTICQYQEFGFDTPANQFLKHILNVLPQHFHDFAPNEDIRLNLEELLRYCQAAFQQVSHKSFSKFNFIESNPFYKEYNLAIQLGNQILALKDYNVSKNVKQITCLHPPFWIDMSKLFELYVFKKLREKYKGKNEVIYHYKTHQQELDFIINATIKINGETRQFKAVVDAKYKPRYAYGNPNIEDARQLSGYTRLNKVYEELNIYDDALIPAYLIYPSNLLAVPEKHALKIDEFLEQSVNDSDKIVAGKVRKSTIYRELYLQEIGLPIT